MMAAGLTFREVATVCSAQKQLQGENLASLSPLIVSCLPMHASKSPKGASHELSAREFPRVSGTSKGMTS